jgi:hypothetical protein
LIDITIQSTRTPNPSTDIPLCFKGDTKLGCNFAGGKVVGTEKCLQTNTGIEGHVPKALPLPSFVLDFLGGVAMRSYLHFPRNTKKGNTAWINADSPPN